jgi:hypothetical protein
MAAAKGALIQSAQAEAKVNELLQMLSCAVVAGWHHSSSSYNAHCQN